MYICLQIVKLYILFYQYDGMGYQLDEKDRLILQALESDSRQSTSSIAKKTGISRVTVHDRIRRLKKQGIIKRFTVELNYDLLGFGDSAYACITFRKEHGMTEWTLGEKLASMPFVHDVSVISGEYDLIVHLRGTSIKNIGETIIQNISPLPPVGKITTMACYRDFKGQFKL